MNTYTFTITDINGQIITVTDTINADIYLGLGFGIYIYNIEKGLPFNTQNIKVDNNSNLVDDVKHECFLPDDFNLELSIKDSHQIQGLNDITYRYLICYNNIYCEFQDQDFIKGIYKALMWLKAEEYLNFSHYIYDTHVNSRVTLYDIIYKL